MGMWFSVAKGLISNDGLQLLRDVASEYLWCPLRDVLEAYFTLGSAPGVHADEEEFIASLLRAHGWPAAAEALSAALRKDPFYLRRVANGDVWPPGPKGQQSVLAGFWLWSR